MIVCSRDGTSCAREWASSGQVVGKKCTNCTLGLSSLETDLTNQVHFRAVPKLCTLSVQSCILLDHVRTQGSVQVVH